jgi:Uma2 family endonuclease
VAVLWASGCSDSNPSLPAGFLGQWYETESSGGLTGEGTGETPSVYIVIQPGGRIDHHAQDGTLLRTTRFALSHGRTIFSTEDLWILDPADGVPEVIQLSADGGTMSLSENVYDGFGRTYARSR